MIAMKSRRDKLGPDPPHHRSTMSNWNYQAELYAFGKRLNDNFADLTLRRALTHASYIRQEEQKRKELGIEEPHNLKENSKLVENGKHLMEDYIKRYLRHTHPYFPEEGICAVYKFLTSDDILAHVSSNIGTSDLILCEDFPPTKATLATTLEAVVGALLQDSGEDKAVLFVQDFVLTQLVGRDIHEMWQMVNPMGVLVDILKREGRGLPESRLVREAGRQTIQAVFNVAIYSDRRMIGMAPGESLPIAEEMAARDALRRMFRLTESKAPLPFGKDGRGIRPPKGTVNPSVNEWTKDLASKCAKAVSV